MIRIIISILALATSINLHANTNLESLTQIQFTGNSDALGAFEVADNSGGAAKLLGKKLSTGAFEVADNSGGAAKLLGKKLSTDAFEVADNSSGAAELLGKKLLNKDASMEFIEWAYIKAVGSHPDFGWGKVPTGTRASTYAIPEFQAAAGFAATEMAEIESAAPTANSGEVNPVGANWLWAWATAISAGSPNKDAPMEWASSEDCLIANRKCQPPAIPACVEDNPLYPDCYLDISDWKHCIFGSPIYPECIQANITANELVTRVDSVSVNDYGVLNVIGETNWFMQPRTL